MASLGASRRRAGLPVARAHRDPYWIRFAFSGWAAIYAADEFESPRRDVHGPR